ncbi:MAG: SGNH/GDSL hydrolase family protein [Cyanobacteria bacterium P01_H01_bin.105]
MRKQLLVTGIAISSCLIPLKAQAVSFTGLNIFGDSLSDSGNLFNLTDTLLTPLGIPALPPPPYAQVNSNGPIWVDNLGEALGLSPTLATDLLLDPTTSPPTEGINFAFAGALSSDSHVLDDDLPFLEDFLPGFQDQIDAFTNLSATLPADPEALYVVWIGANDYNDALSAPASPGGSPIEQLPNTVTNNIISGLEQLSSLGAKEFLVVNLPPIGEAPFADFLEAQTQQDVPTLFNQLSSAHNDLLSAKLNVFGQRQPDVNITTFDINTLFTDILSDPMSFGLTNVTESCLTNFEPVFQFDGVCQNPNEFLFWDDTHPTTAAYQIVSDFALAALNNGDTTTKSVPEPGALKSLFIMGLTGSGLLLAKRKRARRLGKPDLGMKV